MHRQRLAETLIWSLNWCEWPDQNYNGHFSCRPNHGKICASPAIVNNFATVTIQFVAMAPWLRFAHLILTKNWRNSINFRLLFRLKGLSVGAASGNVRWRHTGKKAHVKPETIDKKIWFNVIFLHEKSFLHPWKQPIDKNHAGKWETDKNYCHKVNWAGFHQMQTN